MIQFDEHIFRMGWFNHQRAQVRFFVAYLHSGSEMATAGLLSIILGVAAGLLALVWTWVAFDTGHSSKCGRNRENL